MNPDESIQQRAKEAAAKYHLHLYGLEAIITDALTAQRAKDAAAHAEEVTRLTQDIERARPKAKLYKDLYNKADKERDSLRDEVERLRLKSEDLKGYAGHKPECPWHRNANECACGLSQLLYGELHNESDQPNQQRPTKGDDPNATDPGTALLAERDQLRNERNNWEETAAQHLRNQEFYHGLIRQIGEMFGVAAKTSDDGSIQEDVLALKVPELVSQALARLEAAEADAKRWAALRENMWFLFPHGYRGRDGFYIKRWALCGGHYQEEAMDRIAWGTTRDEAIDAAMKEGK